MPEAMLNDQSTDMDADVIPEPEPTTPTQEELKAKVEASMKYGLAGRRDGAEFCEAVYLPDEGGFAYRRVMSGDNVNPWRFMRTKDFETSYHTFDLVDWDAVETTIQKLLVQGMKWRNRFTVAYKAMGGKSRSRLGKLIAKDLT